MYTLHHLLKLGFKQAAINYHANKGMLNHVKRIRPGGDRIYTAQDIIRLGQELNIAVTEERIKEVNNEL
jgi:DNA-binding transcriptional MerR regulator